MNRPSDDDTQDHDETGPVRRCIASGERRPPADMVRFVVDPGGEVVPDVGESLPGRGLWLSASRIMINTATRKGGFAKAARRRVTVPDDLADRVEGLLARRMVEGLGLARRAGAAVAGFEKVRTRLKDGRAGLLLQALDGAADGRRRTWALAGDRIPVAAVLTAL